MQPQGQALTLSAETCRDAATRSGPQIGYRQRPAEMQHTTTPTITLLLRTCRGAAQRSLLTETPASTAESTNHLFGIEPIVRTLTKNLQRGVLTEAGNGADDLNKDDNQSASETCSWSQQSQQPTMHQGGAHVLTLQPLLAGASPTSLAPAAAKTQPKKTINTQASEAHFAAP